MTAHSIVNDGNAVIDNSVSPSSTRKSNILHRSLTSDPLKVVSAQGNYLHLSNGQKILDATGGAAVSCLGHGDSRVAAAIAKQQAEVSYCHSLFYTTSASEALGKILIEGTEGKMAKAFIVSSGSEAMEAAMKMARQYFLELKPSQNRWRFIARKESYHGTTLGSLSMGGHVARRALFQPLLLDNISRVAPCNAYRFLLDGETEEKYVERLASELDEEFQRVGPETVCAFVAEPIVGAVSIHLIHSYNYPSVNQAQALGCVPAVPGYFKAMKAVCDKYGALLIMDEIMSGMGRGGTLHAWQHEGVVPDLQTIGKGLGGGYAPVAGLLLGHRVVNALQDGSGAFSHGQTYQGHPIACAAAAEVQRIIRDDGLIANVAKMGSLLGQLLEEKLGQHPHVGNIRGRGLFWGVCCLVLSPSVLETC